MSRLYDRILRSDKISETVKGMLAGVPVIVCDNVTRYYYEGTDQEYWDMEKDFPNVAPPFKMFFMETTSPNKVVSEETGVTQADKMGFPNAWGVLAKAIDFKAGIPDSEMRDPETARYIAEQSLAALRPQLDRLEEKFKRNPKEAEADPDFEIVMGLLNVIQKSKDDPAAIKAAMERSFSEKGIRWVIEMITFGEVIKGDPIGPVWSMTFGISPEGLIRPAGPGGKILGGPFKGSTVSLMPVEKQKSIFDEILGLTKPMLLAISFMHCKNVELVDNKPSEKLVKKAVKNHGRPLSRYYTLEIEPLKKILRTEGRSDEVGLQKALHIMRGHFKDFREHGLFGKYKGVYWWPQQLRGKAEVGVVEKDYSVKVAEPVVAGAQP